MEAKICRCCGGKIGVRAESNPNLCIRCEEDPFHPDELWLWPNLQNPLHVLVNAHGPEQVLDFENSWECN